MKLSDLAVNIENIEVLKDCEFQYLDYFNSKLDGKVLTFIEDNKYIHNLSDNIACVICNNDVKNSIPKKFGVLLSENPRITFYEIHNYLSKVSEDKKNLTKTKIGYNCSIDENSIISSNNVLIGDNVTIEEFVVVRENTYIGDNTIIRAGAKIGGVGFQFNKKGKKFFVAHNGGVIIGKNVEIQYNTCVDKAVFPWDNTIIGDDSKIDNLVHVGHAVKIGKDCLVAANATIGGSTVIDDNCWVGVGATISNGIIISNDASVKIGSVVTKDIGEGMEVSGNFAIEHSKFISFIKSIR